MTEELLSVAYSSEATRPYSEGELRDMLGASRAHNALVGVTGMLVYRDGRFLQVVEGPQTVTRELLARIVTDTRHENIRILMSQIIRRRSFADWTMGYERLAARPGSVPRGFRSTFDDLEVEDSEVVQRALRELTIWFRARNRHDA